MLFKEKLTSFLFGPKKEDREEESLLTEEEQLPQEDPGRRRPPRRIPPNWKFPQTIPSASSMTFAGGRTAPFPLPACIWTRTACFPRSCWRRKKTGCNRP